MAFFGSVLLVLGIAMQVAAWLFHRRDFPRFWVSRPVWYFLYPKGVALTVAGVLMTLAGGLMLVDAR